MIRFILTHPPSLKARTRITAFVASLTLASLSLVLSSCSRNNASKDSIAEELIQRYGCGSCHSIPGIDWADAHVGPSLYHYRKRAYIAGMVPNERDSLVQFLMEPTSIHIRTAMPDVGLSATEATVIAQYLYDVQTD